MEPAVTPEQGANPKDNPQEKDNRAAESDRAKYSLPEITLPPYPSAEQDRGVSNENRQTKFPFKTVSVPKNKLSEKLPYQLDPALLDAVTHSPTGIFKGKHGNYRDAQGHMLSPSAVTHETVHKINGWITRNHGKKWPNPVQYHDPQHGRVTHNEVEGIYFGDGVGTVIKAPRVGLPTIRSLAVLSGPHSAHYLGYSTPPYTSAYPVDELSAATRDTYSMFAQLDSWFPKHPVSPSIENLGGRIIDTLNLAMLIEQHPQWYNSAEDRTHTQTVLKHMLEQAIPLYEQGHRLLKPGKNWMDAISRNAALSSFMEKKYGPSWFADLRKEQKGRHSPAG